MSATYFRQAVPEPFRVLGLSLKPLSVGRYRLLHRFDCAFVAEGEASATGADLIIGVLICSMRCEDFLRFANSGEFAREVRRWGRRCATLISVSRLPGVGRW